MWALHSNTHYNCVLLVLKQIFGFVICPGYCFLPITDTTLVHKSYNFKGMRHNSQIKKLTLFMQVKQKPLKWKFTLHQKFWLPYLAQYFWMFSIRSAAGREPDKMVKLHVYSETCLKRNLDRTQFCLWRKKIHSPGMFNLTSSSCIKRNLPATEKKFGPLLFR